MEPIFEYGISQEDSLVDAKALDLRDGDRLLCISSAGEMPLNLLAMFDIRISAVDILESQNCLTRLKLAAVRSLDPEDAAFLTGFRKAPADLRRRLFNQAGKFLPDEDLLFWKNNSEAIDLGPINVARFERYIARFNGLGLMLLKKKHLLKLFEMNSAEEQETYFDRHLSTGLLRGIFRLVFHPRIYKNRGISPQGLTHSGERNMAEFFYGKLKDFCCSTLARENYFLQYSFFDQVLFPEAYPEYLKEAGMKRIRLNHTNLDIRLQSFNEILMQHPDNYFNKLHLSNIGDWMSKDEFAGLLRLISTKSASGTKLLFRYIHYNHPIPDDLSGTMVPDYELGNKLSKIDRYPFYGLVPVNFST
jgi:S-adenosylmethionine:diacylglycerol 3-amino-3-carboxypropyl transferase